MKVVLDCRAATDVPAGIGRVGAALARHLPAQLPGDQVVPLVSARRATPLAPGEVRVDASMIDPVF